LVNKVERRNDSGVSLVATNLARCKNLQARHVVEGVVGLPLAGFGEGHVRVEDADDSMASEGGG